MKKVLVIDGGGARGVIPVTVLKNIEFQMKKPIYEIFDLIVASSIGTIIGGTLALGESSANDLQEAMMDVIPDIFRWRPRFPIFMPKYSRKKSDRILRSHVGDGIQMKECKTKFMCTSVNMCTGRTHFFKSWEEKDGELDIVTAMNRSYAGPLYFGAIKDKENQAIWMDGGTGAQNCPLNEAFVEVCRQDWFHNEKVHILSLGCGEVDFSVPFKKGKRYLNIRQVGYYADPVDGGLARHQSTQMQVEWMKETAHCCENMSFQRISKFGISEKMNKLDAIRYIPMYECIGEEISKEVDYNLLKEK